MRKLLLAAGALLFVSTLSSQTHITAPDGYLNTTGGYYTTHPMWLLRGRWQVGDPTIAKGKATVLLGVDYRTSTQISYTTRNNVSKKWTRITLTLADCDCTKFTSQYSSNYLSKGTLVYSGALTLPKIPTGRPKQVWGNAGAIKFQKVHLYFGKTDLLQDWTYDGGTLANGSKPTVSYSHSYYMDGILCNSMINYIYPDSPYAPGSKWLPASPYNKAGKNCVDSSQTTTYYDSLAYLYARVYSDTYTTVSLRGMLGVSNSYLRYLARSAKAFAALTLFGSDTGVNAGAKCNRLHVNMAQWLALVTTTTNSAGHSPNNLLGTGLLKYNNILAGLPLYWQGAWEDSKTKQFSLTVANKLVLPKKPSGTGCTNCLVYEYYSGTTKRGPNGPYKSYFYNAIDRYQRK